MTVVEHKACRVCGGSLVDILSLGSQYLSDFPAPGEPDGLKAPLELALCGTCRLVQLKHTAPADAMYQNYWYRSGTNQTMRQALADMARESGGPDRLGSGRTPSWTSAATTARSWRPTEGRAFTASGLTRR